MIQPHHGINLIIKIMELKMFKNTIFILAVVVLMTGMVINPCYAGVSDPDVPTVWWDVNGDMEPDTEVFLNPGETLEALLYVSGLDLQEYGMCFWEAEVRYENPEMFNAPVEADTHLHLDFENLRLEYVDPGVLYTRGGYILGENIYGDDNLVLGEFDVMGIPGLDFPGIRLIANELIGNNIDVTIYWEDEWIVGYNGFDLSPILDATTYGLTINPVPIPGAIFLLAPALLGMIGFRRKKA
jgi:uncharacterized membrane protein